MHGVVQDTNVVPSDGGRQLGGMCSRLKFSLLYSMDGATDCQF